MTTWLITGASTGIGRGIAEAVLRHGDNAAITARDARKLDDLVEMYGERVLAVPLEVTDPDMRRAVVKATAERFGSIDVLVNNAGRALFGSVEDTDEKDARLLYETNLFGPIGMIVESLPYMKKAKKGAIVNISSMGVMFENGAGNAHYVASKAALEMLSQVLGNEVAPLGIDVMIVEPGSFRTEFRVSAIGNRPESPEYSGTAGAFQRYVKENPYDQAGDPAKGGEAIYEAVGMQERPKVLVLGKGMIETAQRTLSDRSREIGHWRALSESTDFQRRWGQIPPVPSLCQACL